MEDIEHLGALVIKKVMQSYIGDIIIKRGKTLSDDERRKIGDRVLAIAQKYGIKYFSVTTVNKLEDEDNNEILELITSIFPINLYRESFDALKYVLNIPCRKQEPHEHRGSINIDKEITTLESWTPVYKSFSNLRTMAKAHKIISLGQSVECPYDILDHELSDNIVDCVDTSESLGWEEPPERREHFVENRLHDLNKSVAGHKESQRIKQLESDWVIFGESGGSINFMARSDKDMWNKGMSSLDAIYDDWEESDDVKQSYDKEPNRDAIEHHLLNLENWLKETNDERIREKLLYSCRQIIERFGTTESYKIIKTAHNDKNVHYMIPYNENKDSIDFIEESITKEHKRHELPDIFDGCTWCNGCMEFSNGLKITCDEYKQLCKCRCLIDEHTGTIFHQEISFPEAKICEQQGGYIFKLGHMLPPEKLRTVVDNVCPEKILDSSESLWMFYKD